MTTRRIATFALLCSGLAFCAPRAGVDSAPMPSEGRSLELRLDQTAEADGMTLKWISVADSRCPQGVTCVWAGEATVKLDARDAGETVALTLTLGPRGADTGQTAHHEIRLTDVSPSPRAGNEVARGDYRATVIVKRR